MIAKSLPLVAVLLVLLAGSVGFVKYAQAETHNMRVWSAYSSCVQSNYGVAPELRTDCGRNPYGTGYVSTFQAQR